MAEPIRLDTEQARFDRHRGRLLLGLDHILVIGQLRVGTPIDSQFLPVLEDLKTAGIIDNAGALHPAAIEMSSTFADPEFVVEVETSSDDGVLDHGVNLANIEGRAVAWVRELWPGENRICAYPIEPGLIMPWIALTVGLRDEGTPPKDREPLTAEFGTATKAVATVADDRAAAVDAFRKDGLSDEQATAFARILAALRCSWRITTLAPTLSATAVSMDEAEIEPGSLRSIAILDAGTEGLWERIAPREPIGQTPPAPSSPLTLRPLTQGQAWTAITNLLDRANPGGSEPDRSAK